VKAFSLWQWRPDEMFVKINGRQHYRWRAVDHEGELLESSSQKPATARRH
jgi:putative transposase